MKIRVNGIENIIRALNSYNGAVVGGTFQYNNECGLTITYDDPDVKVGDVVSVTDNGKSYTTYTLEWLTDDVDIIKRYSYNNPPANGGKYKVIKICDPLVFIENMCGRFDGDEVYLIDKCGIKKV